MSKTILKVQNVEKYYGNSGVVTKAINNISFQACEGDFIGIMGASGSGKTTLLNCISTIDKVTSGHIYIEDKDVTELNKKEIAKFRREELGFIFQDFNILDTLTTYENIALALSIMKIDSENIDKKVKEVAETLNITAILNKYPYEMSGGEKQRVAAARAIITNPSLILADEPTGSLDSNAAKVLLESLESLNKTRNSTIILVTHDPFTASFAKRILFIKDGKIFNEIIRGEDSRGEFFNRIIEVVSLLGGDTRHVH
ncbi:multidrug ABC transporter ATP-binding protein [Clostridium carboxidivorans P7]|nr:ABC transporter ATP-binding protein [Clostridium carboxidivorans]AKN30100.1 multidrug ABC transporter ATP-binding protein [Clostridium carboxidivorans P7]EFG86449.1 ABC transporter, ATP-binding protein [Clostridium carboxidivorans P7]